MSKTTLQILKDARELISDPKCWTGFVLARDAFDDEVLPDDVSATCWCAMGATWRAAGGEEESLSADRALRMHLPSAAFSLSEVNDFGNHADVLALFDRAISSEERRAAE